MNEKEYLEHTKKMYLENLKENSDSHLSVQWGSKESQYKRFEVLHKIADDFNESRVLDVGCGIGHFWDFISLNNFQGQYLGIDLLGEMILQAKTRHPDVEFQNKNIEDIEFNAFDYIVMSGIFTFANQSIFEKMLAESFHISQKGMTFNALSTWATQKEEGEFHVDPLKTLEFCSKITPRVVLRHDYLPHDFTIYMYK